MLPLFETPFGEVPCLLDGVLGQRVVSMSMISNFNLKQRGSLDNLDGLL